MRYSPSPPEASVPPAAPAPYRDRKRYAWLLSLLVPATVLIGPALMLTSGDVRALWIPAIFFMW